MRFHMGVSFRLKSLKKFLFPFLIGLLTYFGLSSFNIMKVHAYNSSSTFYNFEYTEINWDNIETGGDYSFEDILDLSNIASDYYYVYTFIERSGGANTPVVYTLRYFLFDKTLTDTYIDIYGRSTTSLGITSYYINFTFNPSRIFTYYQPLFTLSSSMTTEAFETNSQKLYSCLVDNNCTNNFSSTTDTWSSSLNKLSTITNGSSYNYDLGALLMDDTGANRVMPYYTNIPVKYTAYTSTGSTSYFRKLIKFNDTQIDTLEPIKTYCDFYNCSSDEDIPLFNNYSTKFEILYSTLDINHLDTTLFNIYYKVPNAELYTSKIDRYVNLFYGRIDHGTYYSYENINCSITYTSYDDIQNNIIDYTLNNVSCNNSVDLTKYDKIFLYHTIRFTDDNLDKTINDLSIGTSLDYKYTSWKGFIYDEYPIPNNYNYLFSTSGINWEQIYFTSNDSNTTYDIISLDPNLNTTIARSSILECSIDYGNLLEDFGYCPFKFGPYVYTYNIIISNIGTDKQDSILSVFLSSDNIIVSYGETGDTFYYYNSNNELTDSSLFFTYEEKYTENSYDSLNTIFNDINNYITGINGDLAKLHNIINNLYTSIPISYRMPLDIFYIIGLLFILYREIKR